MYNEHHQWTFANECNSDSETEMSNMDGVGTISQDVLQERVSKLRGEGINTYTIHTERDRDRESIQEKK